MYQSRRSPIIARVEAAVLLAALLVTGQAAVTSYAVRLVRDLTDPVRTQLELVARR